MLKAFYEAYSGKVKRVKDVLGRPMTYAEKVLYAHLFQNEEGTVKSEEFNSSSPAKQTNFSLFTLHSSSLHFNLAMTVWSPVVACPIFTQTSVPSGR